MEDSTNFTLYSLAKRAIAVEYVYKICLRAVAWHGSNYLARQKESILQQIGLPRELNDVIFDAIDQVRSELARWIDKHTQLFTNSTKKFYERKKHLILFLDFVVWESTQLKINDWATALEIIQENEDWPTMQFQFCCAYAMEPQLHTFSAVELKTFRRQMDEHPLFELWFSLLQHRKISIFEYGGHTPHQTVSDGFQWAVRFGYYELAQFIFYRVRAWQKEFLGMLHWRRLVAKAEDPDVFQFIGNHLHAQNPQMLVKITAQMFINNLKCAMENKRLNPPPIHVNTQNPQTSTQNANNEPNRKKVPKVLARYPSTIEESPRSHPPNFNPYYDRSLSTPSGEINRADPWNQSYNDPWDVAKFLLDHSAPQMRHCLLSVNKYQAFTAAAFNRDVKLFRELASYLPENDRGELQKVLATELADSNMLVYLVRVLEDFY